MKKRRTLIISLLLIAALALGIGYALDATVLDIDGRATISPDASALSVVFDKDVAVTSTNEDLATGSYDATSDTKAIIQANGFTGPDQSVVVTYTIKNTGDYDVVIEIETVLPNHDETTDEPLHVESELVKISGVEYGDQDGQIVLKAGQSIEAAVTVQSRALVSEEVSTLIDIVINATAIDTMG